MALTKNHPLGETVLDSTASSVATGVAGYVRAPFKGRLIQAGTILGGATTTADATVTVSIAGTAVTGGAFVITQSSSAAGDHDYAATGDSGANSVITGANIVNENDAIKFALTGSGTGGGHVYCYAVLQKLS
jgi:hypothetical protein